MLQTVVIKQITIGSKENCWGNAVAERFFLNLKMERVWQRNYAKQDEAKRDIADYIVSFYNTERVNSVPENMSPAAFEQKWRLRQKILLNCPKLLDQNRVCSGGGVAFVWVYCLFRVIIFQ